MSKFYKHYKNKPYKYLGVVHHSETQEPLVLYESLYKNDLGPLWVRPQKMFHEDVTVNGKTQARFAKVPVEYRHESNIDAESLQLITEISNKVLRPLSKNEISERLKTQKKVLYSTAWIENQLVGFKIGYALDENVFYSWLGAMDPQFENLGIAKELLQGQHAWAKRNKFHKVETRCLNLWKKMMILNLTNGFDIVAVAARDDGEIKIIMQKNL